MLIVLSRYIEKVAFEEGSGEIHTGLQYISRIDDEKGTKEVYEKIENTSCEVNLYGRDCKEVDYFNTYSGSTKNYTDTWFVVFKSDDRQIGLVCEKIGKTNLMENLLKRRIE